MALLARCRLVGSVPSQRVGLFGMSGLRLRRSMSTAAPGSPTPSKEELIKNYPYVVPWGKTVEIPTRTGKLKMAFRDAPGVHQHRTALRLNQNRAAAAPEHDLILTGKLGRIATTLFNAAKAANVLDSVVAGWDASVAKLADTTVVTSIYNPTATREMRTKLVKEVAASVGAPACVGDTLAQLMVTKMYKKAKNVRRNFIRLAEYHKKEVLACVTSADPLTDEQFNAISAKLHKLVKPDETLIIDRHVEPSIVGGLMIRVGNKVQDLTVSSAITRMERHLSTFFATNRAAVDKILIAK